MWKQAGSMTRVAIAVAVEKGDLLNLSGVVMNRLMNRAMRIGLVAAAASLLVACGGGSSGGGTDVSAQIDKGRRSSPTPTPTASTGYTLLAWNDLGMHCVDGKDYSVFSILPPYNNLHAQLVSTAQGGLITSGVTLT